MTRSTEAQAYRRLYKTKRWRSLKLAAHHRDQFTCRMCGKLHPTLANLVADHIREHKGDPDLFFDLDNIQSLCASPCHNRWKQRQERAAPRDADGWLVYRPFGR